MKFVLLLITLTTSSPREEDLSVTIQKKGEIGVSYFAGMVDGMAGAATGAAGCIPLVADD